LIGHFASLLADDRSARVCAGADEIATLTLVTCYPFYFIGGAPQRHTVKAEVANPPATNAPSLVERQRR
jgi:sortase (surface protein transpeptidase)